MHSSPLYPIVRKHCRKRMNRIRRKFEEIWNFHENNKKKNYRNEIFTAEHFTNYPCYPSYSDYPFLQCIHSIQFIIYLCLLKEETNTLIQGWEFLLGVDRHASFSVGILQLSMQRCQPLNFTFLAHNKMKWLKSH